MMTKQKLMSSKYVLLAFITLIVIGSCSRNSTNKNVHIVPIREIQSLNDLVNYKDFKNKVLYITFWEKKSDPSILELKYYDELENKYDDKDIEFVFLTINSNSFMDFTKWKNVINDYNLEGYHIQSVDLIDDLLKNFKFEQDTFPINFLVDKFGNLKKEKAAKSSEKEKLYKQLEELL